LLKAFNFFGDLAEAGDVALGVAPAGFVGDDAEAFAESGGEIG
jgi:hypothetical protein